MSMEQQHLAESERHIAEFKRRVVEQEKRIGLLAADGHPTDDALDLLKQFKETLRLGEEHRAMILRELRGDFEEDVLQLQ